jgi:endo-1,4-beta-xylanase
MNRRQFISTGAAALGYSSLTAGVAGEMFGQAASAQSGPTLKALGAPCGMKVGVASTKNGFHYSPPAFTDWVKANCNVLTMASGLQWNIVHPQPDVYNFDDADWMYDFGKQNGMVLRGHSLCWNEANAPWVAQTVNQDNAESVLVSHINKVAGRFAGKLDAWNVVNEPISTWKGQPGGFAPGIWLGWLGPRYIDIAFHAAAAADPHSQKVLNVHHVEAAREEDSRQATLRLLEGMLKRNVPVQELGIESHLDCAIPIDQELLATFLQQVRSMGLAISITELDVNDAKVDGDNATRDKAVANLYRQYLDVVLPVADVHRMIFWSPTDKSWLDGLCRAPQWKRNDGSCEHRPGLLDLSMRQKPAFDAVVGGLQAHCKGKA